MGYVAGTSGADFRSRCRLINERVREQVRQKIINYSLVLHQQLVLNTPIQTGQARANWAASVGTIPGTFVGLHGPTTDYRDLARALPETVDWSAYTASAEAVIRAYQPGQVLYIYSNLPYIESLNTGTSKQAPAGFVETAVMTASATIRR